MKHAAKTLGLEGNFLITKELLDEVELVTSPNCMQTKLSNRKSGRRLDAISLIKAKRLSGVPSKEIREGFIYIMSNPAWPGYFKVGRSLESRDRLLQAQVFSPFSDFKIEGYYLVSDMREVESWVHGKLKRFNSSGEWFNSPLENIRKLIKRSKLIIE